MSQSCTRGANSVGPRFIRTAGCCCCLACGLNLQLECRFGTGSTDFFVGAVWLLQAVWPAVQLLLSSELKGVLCTPTHTFHCSTPSCRPLPR